MHTTGDTRLDALVVFGVAAVLLLVLCVLAAPLEGSERGRRFADGLLRALFGPVDE